MAEEEREDGTKEQEAEAEEQPGEPEEIDIELTPPQPARRRGWGAGPVTVVVIVAAVLVWYLLVQVQRTREREVQEHEARVEGYQSRLLKIGTDLKEPAEDNEEGDVSAAIQGLETAASRISDVAASAAAAGDDEFSEAVHVTKRAANKAAAEARAQQTELQELVADSLRDIRRRLGAGQEAKPAEEATAEEVTPPGRKPPPAESEATAVPEPAPREQAQRSPREAVRSPRQPAPVRPPTRRRPPPG